MKGFVQLMSVSMSMAKNVVTGSRDEAKEMGRDPRYIETFRKIGRAEGFDAESVRERYANFDLQGLITSGSEHPGQVGGDAEEFLTNGSGGS